MKTLNRNKRRCLSGSIKNATLMLMLAFFGLAMFSVAPAPAVAQEAIGSVLLIKGDVVAESKSRGQVILEKGTEVFIDDTIISTKNGFVVIKMIDDTKITLRPNSELLLTEYNAKSGEESATVELVKGGLRAITGSIAKNSPESFEVVTPTTTIGIRGTDFSVRMCLDDTGAACGNACAVEERRLANYQRQASTPKSINGQMDPNVLKECKPINDIKQGLYVALYDGKLNLERKGNELDIESLVAARVIDNDPNCLVDLPNFIALDPYLTDDPEKVIEVIELIDQIYNNDDQSRIDQEQPELYQPAMTQALAQFQHALSRSDEVQLAQAADDSIPLPQLQGVPEDDIHARMGNLLGTGYPSEIIFNNELSRGFTIHNIVDTAIATEPDRETEFRWVADLLLDGAPSSACGCEIIPKKREWNEISYDALKPKTIEEVARAFFEDDYRLARLIENSYHGSFPVQELADLLDEQALWYRVLPVRDHPLPPGVIVSLYKNEEEIIVDGNLGLVLEALERGDEMMKVMFLYYEKDTIPINRYGYEITGSEVRSIFRDRGLKVNPPPNWKQGDFHAMMTIEEVEDLVNIPERDSIDPALWDLIENDLSKNGFLIPGILAAGRTFGADLYNSPERVAVAKELGIPLIPVVLFEPPPMSNSMSFCRRLVRDTLEEAEVLAQLGNAGGPSVSTLPTLPNPPETTEPEEPMEPECQPTASDSCPE